MIKPFAAKCYRTILIAYADYTESEWESLKEDSNNFASDADRENIEKGLTMVGVFGLMDPLREGIPEAVLTCHRAGINVRMVTGDNIDTARAISKQANIVTDEELANDEDGYVCMTGEAFRNEIGGAVVSTPEGKVECVIRNMNKFRKIMPRLKVLARSQPDDKFMLVHGLIKEGKVVSVTGDGTNDAPALNRSDVGFAMGKTGTDVAKNASDI